MDRENKKAPKLQGNVPRSADTTSVIGCGLAFLESVEDYIAQFRQPDRAIGGSMTTVDMEKLADSLHRLLLEQILVRASLSGNRDGSMRHCVIELVSLTPHLHRGEEPEKHAWGFAHLSWYCGPEERKGPFRSSPLYPVTIYTGRDHHLKQVTESVRSHTVKVAEHWRDNITGDGPRPYPEWLEAKPFVGVASIGTRPNASIIPLQKPSSMLAPYFGYLLGRLEAYLESMQDTRRRFGELQEEHYLLFKDLLYRWRMFVEQTGQEPFRGLFSL